MNKIVVATCAVLVGILFVSCTSKKQSTEGSELAKLTLTSNLNISAENSDILIGTISGVATDGGGRIYAADTKLQKIHIFSSDGEYVDSLGHKGKGPGEFLRMDPNIRVKADTLYVHDKGNEHISLFNLNSHQLIRTINVSHEKVKGESMGHLRKMFPLHNGKLMVAFEYAYPLPPKENDPSRMTTISLLDRNGNFEKKDCFQIPTPYPSDQKLALLLGHRMYVFTRLSFYPDTKMAMGPGEQLYIGKSDSLSIQEYDRNGRIQDQLVYDYQPSILTNTDSDSILAQYKGNHFKKAVKKIGGFPDHWPAFRHLLFDDRGRCWVALENPHSARTTWVVFNRDGQPKWQFKIPDQVTIHSVHNGQVYAISKPKGGIPSIIRYSAVNL